MRIGARLRSRPKICGRDFRGAETGAGSWPGGLGCGSASTPVGEAEESRREDFQNGNRPRYFRVGPRARSYGQLRCVSSSFLLWGEPGWGIVGGGSFLRGFGFVGVSPRAGLPFLDQIRFAARCFFLLGPSYPARSVTATCPGMRPRISSALCRTLSPRGSDRMSLAISTCGVELQKLSNSPLKFMAASCCSGENVGANSVRNSSKSQSSTQQISSFGFSQA